MAEESLPYTFKYIFTRPVVELHMISNRSHMAGLRRGCKWFYRPGPHELGSPISVDPIFVVTKVCIDKQAKIKKVVIDDSSMTLLSR